MDKKIKNIIFIVSGCFVGLFLFLFILSSCDKKITPNKLEERIVEKTKKYYETHKDELPKINSTVTLSLGDLVSKEIIEELDKLLEDDTMCSGSLTIENNNNYYMYNPKLNCTNGTEIYKTSHLKDLIMEDVVTSGNGLYNINGEYHYRGDNVDNYVIFDGLLWRIIKINKDNTIKLIEVNRRDPIVWDDRYNEITQSNNGVNNYYFNNLSSRIKENLDTLYEGETLLTNDAKGFIKETTLCIGKRSVEDISKDGSTECTTTLDKQYYGLIQLNEYLIASLDENCINANSSACSNYNYLADFTNSYWTLTANSENNHQVYKINSSIMTTTASSSGMPRIVINISENVNVTGEGTIENPYLISGLQTELRNTKKTVW